MLILGDTFLGGVIDKAELCFIIPSHWCSVVRGHYLALQNGSSKQSFTPAFIITPERDEFCL